MALPESTRRFVEKRLDTYCEERIPEHAKIQVRMGYKIRGNHVTLFEERPSFPDFEVWVNIPVAQFRFNPEQDKWTLYWSDRNSKWHEYYDLEPNQEFEVILQEVDDDPTGIFWR